MPFSRLLRCVATLVGLLGLALGLACGSAKGAGGVGQYYGNYHPSGWLTVHGGQAVAGLSTCTRCHEISILRVGSGVPTCLTTGCHHQGTPSFPDAGVHGRRAKLPAGDPTGGGLAACQLCHSRDFAGPNATACASCHGVPAPHPPKPWRIASGSAFTHVDVDPSNAVVCAQCHFPGSTNNPAGHPATPAPAGTQPGCFNATLCHGEHPAPHPVPFLAGQTDANHNGHFTVTATAFAADCATCHAYSGASPITTAPLCNVCHQLADPTAPGSQAGTCLSCHVGAPGLPQGPTSNGFPSIAGAHAAHLGLATHLTCDTCHAGSGSGTFTHYDNANARLWDLAGPASVAIDATFTAKGRPAPTFADAALTCSNVSCHGGQTTPAWEFGTIDVRTQCSMCHGVASSAGTAAQYNDAFGRHSLGTHNALTVANGIACTTCHDMANGSPGALAHFKYLDTPAVDGVATGSPADQLPSGTIVFDPGLVSGSRVYAVTATTQGSGTCSLTCHAHIHTAAVNDWTFAGVPHPVPFLQGQLDTQGHGHLNATAATFAADCANCHAYTGTSPNASAPLCVVCHALADPTAPAAGAGTCLSCHSGPSGLPKGPTGSAFPSVAGAHAKHLNLATPLVCDSCHAGSGSGSATHYANANARVGTPTGPGTVAVDALFKAKSGGNPTFAPASLTCANISCHGGQATPAWQGGSLDSSTQCAACHAVASTAATATQFNDAFGRHSLGSHNAANATNGIACTTCHAMGNGSPGALAHFKYLNTSAVDGVATGLPADQMPSGTIAFNPAIVSGAGTYAVTSATQGNGGCALTCHTHIHVAAIDTWTASGAPHPIPFLSGQADTQGNGHLNATAATFTADCSACHAYSGTSPMAGAPLCNVCHALANPTVVASGAGTCLSCHAGASGLPAGPTGTAFPNIAGAHGKHLGLATHLTCDTCHAGSGAGTTTHYTNANARLGPLSGPAPVVVSTVFNAKSGAASWTPASLTCASVSCHGGQTTPQWRTGSLNSATQCTACHGVASSAATSPQFNTAFGRHSLGSHNALNAANAIACTTCHNMANGSPGALAHFKYLDTPAVDGVATGLPADQLPSGTIAFNPAIVTGPGTYSVTASTQGNGGCALTCHTHVHTAAVNEWTSAGVPHPVPFLSGQVDAQGNGHLNATAATFTADCANCHAYSGTSPNAASPLCNVCHALANPTSAATGAGTCLSCHTGTSGLPKGPGGTGFPSIAGAHLKHLSLGTALTCDTCHLNAGSGTATHYTNANARIGTPAGPATVSIDFQYKAMSGGNPAFAPASLTCSNVSCHGGQTTPGWQVGTLNTATQCSACHGVASSAGTITQYNDAFGRHSLGTHNALNPANGILCTTCHAMGNGSPGALAHFKYLNTAAVDGVATGLPSDQMPSGTIAFDPALAPGGTYTVTAVTQGNGGCALTCHTHIHVAAVNTWTASGAPHPVPFYAGATDTQGNGHLNATATTFAADCAACHATSGTSPLVTAPACAICHALASPVQAATGAGTCLSCHVGPSGLPNGPAGVTFPSIAGAHGKHMGLATALTCNTCHANAGAGTTTHYANANARVAPPAGPATVSIDATFNAQSGNTAGFNPSALTCSSTSCHGGLVTPNWQTGSLASATQCLHCHAINDGTQLSQYNDAIGRHAWGTHATAAGQDCALCHDMTRATAGAQNHFAELDTPAVSSTNKLPSTTIVFKLTSGTYPITGAATYTIDATYPEGDGGCALTCHSQIHTPANNHWAMPRGSGVAHPVPFYAADVSTGGNHHQTLTLAQFNGECINCHDLGGTSAKSGPTCAVCHTLADPTAVATGAGTCLSCHVGANFPTQGPSGNAWPSLKGAHPKHLGLATFTRSSPALPASLTTSVCEACHVGSVPGDAANTHYSNANKRVSSPVLSGPASVSIDATFNAKSGAAGFTASASAFTCSNISCHGGQTTPGWQSGTLTVNATTYCTNCHRVTATSSSTQYNDATGRHQSVGAHNTTCDYCHDMTQARTGAQNHWKYLDTTVVRVSPDQLSSDTIAFGGGAQPPTGALTYTVNATIGRGGCALSCHGTTHTTSNNVWN